MLPGAAHADWAAAVRPADETGWGTNGLLTWLWGFACDDATYDLIHPKRGHEARRVFFTEAVLGVLVTDFWTAHDVVTARQQECRPRLLRELAAIDDWPGFLKKLWRVYGDAGRPGPGLRPWHRAPTTSG